MIDITYNLQNIPVTLTDRKWMRIAKSWRLSFSLPESNIPVLLSALIDKTVYIKFINQSQSSMVEINPALIVDIPSRGKIFHLVVETCNEQQNGIGPTVTSMIREAGVLSVYPCDEKGKPEIPPPPLSQVTDPTRNRILTGLHVLFNNHKFQEYVSSVTGVEVRDNNQCKIAFKKHMQVESCKDLTIERINQFRTAFNQCLQGD